MPDHRHSPPAASPEELLDRWLDALNEPGSPQEPPEAIALTADVARRYHDALGRHRVTAPEITTLERTGSMAPQSLTGTVPIALRHSVTSGPARSPGRLSDRFTGGISTAALIFIVVVVAAMVAGGGLWQQVGWPGTGENESGHLALLAPGTASPASEPLACGSPGYRTIVEGEVNDDTLAAIGITETPLQVDGDILRIPTSRGEIVELPSTWTPLPGSSLWTDVQMPRDSLTTTVRNVENGREWHYPESNTAFLPVHEAQFLILPVSADQRDWRIVDTVTGEERLVSEIRGEPFDHLMRVNRHFVSAGSVDEPSVIFFAFMPAYESESTLMDALTDLGPNVLIIGDTLDSATFLPETADVRGFNDTEYSTETGRLAYATGSPPALNVLDLGSGESIEVEHDQFTAELQPLTFLDDGVTLIADQPGTLFSIFLARESPEVAILHEGEPFIPLSYNVDTALILVRFEDGHIAMIDARSGEVNDLPDVTYSPWFMGDPTSMIRSPGIANIRPLFNPDTGSARFVNLTRGTVSEEIPVLHTGESLFDPPFQQRYQHYEEFPFVSWTSGYGYLDGATIFRALSLHTDEGMWSIPAPEGFAVEDSQVVDISTTPGGECLVMNVIMGAGTTVVSGGNELNRVTTWIAPLGPDAEWRRLDIAITGWWEVTGETERVILPAPDLISPGATPEE